MGNTALTREVDDISKDPGHSRTSRFWQIRDGKLKETDENVSVWTFI